MALPTFLVVGAQKSGTTTLTHYLAAHPEVHAPRSEVHYFDKRAHEDLAWYEAHFRPAPGERAVGESTPEYLFHPHVAPLLAARLPEARLVAILRNPVDRAYSHYWHNRTRGKEPLAFAAALAAEDERMAAAGDPARRAKWAYQARGRYIDQLEHLTAHVARQRLLVVLFDDLVAAPVEVAQRVYGFLGVDASFVPPAPRQARNPYYEFRSQRLRRPIKRLPIPLRRVALRLNARAAEYLPMDAAVRAGLLARFAPANDRLAAWLDRDLSGWHE